MPTLSDTHARSSRADIEAASHLRLPPLDVWPDDPHPVPRRRGVWRGAAAILIAGVATIALISVGLLESTHRIPLGIWVWLGIPLLLLASAAARVTASRVDRPRLGRPLNPDRGGRRRVH